MARFSPDPGQLAHWACAILTGTGLYTRGQWVITDSYKELCPGRACKVAEWPRGRDRLAHEDLPWGGWDSSTWLATMRIKPGLDPFTSRTFYDHFSVSPIQTEIFQGLKPSGKTPTHTQCSTFQMSSNLKETSIFYISKSISMYWIMYTN